MGTLLHDKHVGWPPEMGSSTLVLRGIGMFLFGESSLVTASPS